MHRAADCVEKPLQDIELSRLPILVTCGACPRNHPGLSRALLPVTHRGPCNRSLLYPLGGEGEAK